MQPLHVYSVVPKLPETLEPLWFLARNYWFAWNNDLKALFSDIDPELWSLSEQNPVWMLNHVSQKRFNALSADPVYVERITSLTATLKHYLETPSEYLFEDIRPGSPAIAYFSLEFGVAPCLPIYSGGLGILAGDHLKSASDLNIPLVAFGFAYAHGYFRQYMTPDGWQQERYPDYDFEQMPLQKVLASDGEPLKVQVQIGERPVYVQLWRAQVGRIPLYLLDTNLAENPFEFRQITSKLYGGDLEMRLWQEIVLGFGGISVLRALGLNPDAIHMNEGHSAFAAVERVRLLMEEDGLPFEVAVEVAAAGSIFTTHTPVPAGNDRFPVGLMQKYFEPYARSMGLAFKVFMALGREVPQDDGEDFCMTVLALRLSRYNNGVSRLHGKVSRNMWKRIWGQFPVEDVPIGAITNGVHAPTWVSPDMGTLYDRYLGATWKEASGEQSCWKLAPDIPDAEIWRTHERMRHRLVDFVRARMKKQMIDLGARNREVQYTETILDPDALTIGFARRFATYKRARLLTQDLEKLRQIIHNTERPVQFIFAGKAHPADNDGKRMIQELISLFRQEEFQKSLVFIEDYDMHIAANMVSGCDIWLNNPRRPLEACGTSGMKAMFNGVLQFSTLDGWWDEAWAADNSLGWAIGKGEDYEDPDYQDTVELQTLYRVLTSDIIPEFYERDRSNIPAGWVRRMKAALAEFGPRFHSNRMVRDYMSTSYIPACSSHHKLYRDDFAAARELSAWRMNIMTKWGEVRIRDVHTAQDTPSTTGALFTGQDLQVTARVFLADIPVEHIQVDIYSGTLGHDDSFLDRRLVTMHPEGPGQDGWQVFIGRLPAEETGRFGLTVRAMPVHPLLPKENSLGLLTWAE